MNIHALSASGGGGARKSARASSLPLCFSAARCIQRERCRTKNGCSCACAVARLVSAVITTKFPVYVRQHFYLQRRRRRRRMERAAFLFCTSAGSMVLNLISTWVRALPLLTLTVLCAPRSVFPGARSKCSWTLSFPRARISTAFGGNGHFWQTQPLWDHRVVTESAKLDVSGWHQRAKFWYWNCKRAEN